MRRAWLLGVAIDLPSRAEALGLIDRHLHSPDAGLLHIVTVNAECLAIASADPTYRCAISRAGLRLVDGVGVALALRLKGVDGVERFPGVELVWELASLCQRQGSHLFLLGATPAVLAEAGRRLAARYPGLTVDGFAPPRCPDHRFPPAVEQTLLERLRRSHAQALCVALGMPKQELWVDEHRPQLAALGVRTAVGVGGALDYIAGRMPPPPQWVRRGGLEWAYRLLREPHRRLGRQGSRLPRFLVLALAEVLAQRMSASTGHRPLC